MKSTKYPSFCENCFLLKKNDIFQFLGAKFRQRAKKVMITRPLRRLSSITKPHPTDFEETLFTRISTYSSRSSTQTSRNSSGYKITFSFNNTNFSEIFFGIKQIWIAIAQTAQEGYEFSNNFSRNRRIILLRVRAFTLVTKNHIIWKSKHFKSHYVNNNNCEWNPFRNKLPTIKFN